MVEILTRYWDSQPLHTTIRELLDKKQGVMTDDVLYKAITAAHNDVSLRDFNKTLMKLEVDGIIHVFELTKTKRRVELARRQ